MMEADVDNMLPGDELRESLLFYDLPPLKFEQELDVMMIPDPSPYVIYN